MFITPAYAQGAPGGGSDFMLQLIPILLMFVIFYFLLIRPQQQRAKQHREMVNNIRRGDTVVTSGGIIGKVTRVVIITNQGHSGLGIILLLIVSIQKRVLLLNS